MGLCIFVPYKFCVSLHRVSYLVRKDDETVFEVGSLRVNGKFVTGSRGKRPIESV